MAIKMRYKTEVMTFAIRQPDLFPPAQPDLLANAEPDLQTPERMMAMVRPKLAALLAEARAAERMPWTAQVAEVNALLFHNMANWLPAEEKESLRAAFRAELARLKSAG
jgi:hypothetical protein